MLKVVVYLLECTIDILTWKALDRHQGSPQTRKFGILKKGSEALQIECAILKFICWSWNETGFHPHLDRCSGCPVWKQPVWRKSALKRKNRSWDGRGVPLLILCDCSQCVSSNSLFKHSQSHLLVERMFSSPKHWQFNDMPQSLVDVGFIHVILEVYLSSSI